MFAFTVLYRCFVSLCFKPLNLSYMKFSHCRYSKQRDIMRVVPSQGVVIPDALDYGRIKDSCVHTDYNGQSTCAEVGTRIEQPFDVIEYERSYTKLRKYINDKEKEKESKK